MFSIKEREKIVEFVTRNLKTISPFILICSDQCRKKENFKSKQRYEKLKNVSAYAKFLKKSRDRLRKYPVGSSKYCKCCLKNL